ncbi:MAG: hypothetical protein S4CHLAM123_07390 [Chlamydiales bacterium]|nr:hypothetical protein [Chlamydiales bacterium]
MDCLSQLAACFSFTLEQLGFYEPELSINEAKERLNKEGAIWNTFQCDRTEVWNDFLSSNEIKAPLSPLINKAIVHLKSQNIQKGVAVDLGCGISATSFNLLDCGWKVYAVDSSALIIQSLEQKVASIGKKWIEEGKLILVNKSIEEFEYPEKVHLISAVDSIPYCDPRKINDIFLKAKNSLHSGGIFAFSLFPYADLPLVDSMLRIMFGGWMTTKNVIEAVMKCIDFSSYSIAEEKSPDGKAKQFHVFALA